MAAAVSLYPAPIPSTEIREIPGVGTPTIPLLAIHEQFYATIKALPLKDRVKLLGKLNGIEPLMTVLRDKETSPKKFHKTAGALSHTLANYIRELLPKEEISIQTPVEATKGVRLRANPIFVPVIRSGTALIETFWKHFPEAPVYHIGMARDEQTAIAKTYYSKVKDITPKPEDYFLVLEPMIASGGSACETLKHLSEAGVSQDHIIFASYIAAPEGLARLEREYPKVQVALLDVDEKLNEHKFIVPGLGDFGDRYFG